MEKTKGKWFGLAVLVLIAAALIISLYVSQNHNAGITQRPNQSQDFKSNGGITIVPTMNEQMLGKNTAWCGSFQLIWNDLKDELVKQDIVFDPQPEVVNHLNQADFNTSMLSEDYYYKKYGKATPDLKREIENGIQTKFNEKSSILDNFSFQENSQDYFLYAMLKRNFEYQYELEDLDVGSFANQYENIRYFGLNEKAKAEIRSQIHVMYYHSPEDFAIFIETKSKDNVILCRSNTGSTLNEIYNNMKQKQKEYTGEVSFTEQDTLKIPNMKMKEKIEFQELEGRNFAFADGSSYFIDKAIQTIEFELDRKGGSLKSEAAISSKTAVQMPEEKREFHFDNAFTIFLQDSEKEKPYFAMKVEDITKLQPTQ